MELKPGFKPSDVGPIPVAWEVRPLGAVAFVGSGGTPRRDIAAYWDGGIPWVTTSQIDFNRIAEAEQFISDVGLKNSAAKLLPPGTLLMALYGQGKTRGKVALLAIEATTNQACASLIVGDSISNEYLLHFLSSRYEAIRGSSNSGGQENLSGQIVKALPVVVPPLPEQRAIAAALGDVDALLAGLVNLIAKKRDLKQAAMQQLLTGRTRLPGFSGNWETRQLGQHVEFLRNGTNSRAELDAGSAARYLHYGDIHTSPNVTLDVSAVAMPRLAPEKAGNLDRLAPGDLVFVDASEDMAGVGKAVEIVLPPGIEVVAGLHTIACRFDKAVLADGYKAYLPFVPLFREQLTRLAAGTKVYSTSHRHIAGIRVPLPSTSEQTAIAQVLSDMAAEISVLEGRVQKTRAIKQGIMQELLTGRTRLV